MSTCRVFSFVVGRECLLWPVCSLGKTLLAFALLHFELQGQICLLLQVSLDFLLLHSSPLWWKEHLFGVLVLEHLAGLHRTIQLQLLEHYWSEHQFSPIQSLSHVRLSATWWTAACQASLSITNSWWSTLPKLMSIESVMPSNHLILCRPLLLLPSIFPSINVFSNESALCIRWPKYWSYSFNISPSNEHSGLISFRMDWLDLLAVQRTLKSLL